MKLKRPARLVSYALLLLGVIFSVFASRFPRCIEAEYSEKLYVWMIRPYSQLTGLFPFSLAELILAGGMVFILYRFGRAVILFFRNPKGWVEQLPAGFFRLTTILAVIYLVFYLMWGLNYSRMTFAEISGLPVGPGSVKELSELALQLTQRANALRGELAEDDRGVMMLPHGIDDMFSRADLGFKRAAQIYPELGGRYGRPKGVVLSHYWSYTGITGAIFPFTAEANVNIDIPRFMLPSTTAHEMAHLRGFAREDEANFIAYLTCTLHPDPDFQYSGTMLALIHTMNTLQRYDEKTWSKIRSQYSAGVQRDLKAWDDYWECYEGPVEHISTRVNDTYLKANRQAEGVYSYGRMVDLLLAEFRVGRDGSK